MQFEVEPASQHLLPNDRSPEWAAHLALQKVMTMLSRVFSVIYLSPRATMQSSTWNQFAARASHAKATY